MVCCVIVGEGNHSTSHETNGGGEKIDDMSDHFTGHRRTSTDEEWS